MTQRNFQLSCWKLVLKVVTLACNAFMSSHSHVEDCPPDHSRVKQSDLAPQVGFQSIQVGRPWSVHL